MNVDLTLDELKTLVSLTLGTDCQLVYKLQTAIKEITKPTKEDCIKWAKLSKGVQVCVKKPGSFDYHHPTWFYTTDFNYSDNLEYYYVKEVLSSREKSDKTIRPLIDVVTEWKNK